MALQSEDDILAMLGEYFPIGHESLLLGRGDDCAIVRAGGPWAVTCDVFAEDAHFRRRYFSGYDVGYKSLAVNVSDVASAGAQPMGCVVGLTLPHELTGTALEDWLRGFAQGLADMARACTMALAGGDLTRATALHVCITAWGELTYPDLRRGRAQAGDILFVVGDIGLARVGLSVLEASVSTAEAEKSKAQWPVACTRHLRPEPHVAAGLGLAKFADSVGDSARFSLMDVSDGLARDLPRLLDSRRSGLGAELALAVEDLHSEVIRYANSGGLDPAEFAFRGGEDYALLGSCPARHWDALHAFWQSSGLAAPLQRVGKATADALFLLNGRLCRAGGFDHFSS